MTLSSSHVSPACLVLKVLYFLHQQIHAHVCVKACWTLCFAGLDQPMPHDHWLRRPDIVKAKYVHSEHRQT